MIKKLRYSFGGALVGVLLADFFTHYDPYKISAAVVGFTVVYCYLAGEE